MNKVRPRLSLFLNRSNWILIRQFPYSQKNRHDTTWEEISDAEAKRLLQKKVPFDGICQAR
jgi:hypothetical protein